jgi:hypothetical protein
LTIWKVIPMLSRMETDDSRRALAAQLHEIDRGQAAPWVICPPMGWWWPAAFGVWSATYTLTTGLLDGFVGSALQLLHVLVMLAAIRWMRRVRGTYPSGRAPRELRGPFALVFGGGVVVALWVWGVFVWLGPWVAALAALVLAWSLVAAYERSYARAAARVRERLA